MSDDKKNDLLAESAKESNKGSKMIGKGRRKLDESGNTIFGGISGLIKGITADPKEASDKLASLIEAALKAGKTT